MKTTATLAAVVTLCALVAAGCGGGSGSPGVASITESTTTATTPASTSKGTNAKQTFSQCMRAHGVPKFPDAQPGGGIAIDAGSGVDPQSPQFQAAQKACKSLAPDGGKPPSAAQQAKMQEQMLKFSSCMRSHGVPKFPDPKFTGNGAQLTLDRRNGIDPNSPIFQAAQKACQKDMPKPKGGGTTNQVGGPGSGGPAGGSTQGAAK
jgi:hypothetical protein